MGWNGRGGGCVDPGEVVAVDAPPRRLKVAEDVDVAVLDFQRGKGERPVPCKLISKCIPLSDDCIVAHQDT